MAQTKSESLVNLAPALAKAQAVMPTISLDGKVRFKDVSFEYATLSNIIYCTKPLLAQHGLTVLQFPTTSKDGEVFVETMLLHESGEWVSSTITGYLVKTDPKELGSLITYLRRYSYASLLSIALDGDYDAELISEKYVETAEQKKWLASVASPLGVTETETLRKISAEMKRGVYDVSEESVIRAMETLRK